jgi:hypothetical protein
VLWFDVAFTECTFAVVSQLAEQGIQPAAPLNATEMAREILDRLSRKTTATLITGSAQGMPPQVDLDVTAPIREDGQTV